MFGPQIYSEFKGQMLSEGEKTGSKFGLKHLDMGAAKNLAPEY